MKQDRQLAQQVRAILLHQWDPIGVKDMCEAHDEYDSYVAKITQFVQEQKDAVFLANHLVAIETQDMQVFGDPIRATEVAKQLLDLSVRQKERVRPRFTLYSRVKLLTTSYQDAGVTKGSIGSIIEMYHEEAYEVEFSASSGETIAQVILTSQDIEEAE